MDRQYLAAGALHCPKCGSLIGFPVSPPNDGTGTLPGVTWFCWPCLRAALIAMGVPLMVRA